MSRYLKHVSTELRVAKNKVSTKYKESKKVKVPAVQNFEEIRRKCLENGELFIDTEFPASSISISKGKDKTIVWKRPKDIVSSPKFFVDGASRFDIKQGKLGDCWFLTAISNLTLNEQLLKQVVPHDQSFHDNYAGIFHFWFWQFGDWIEVVVDDLLPTCDGKLVFLYSRDTNEFWASLLEKAYAKLHGSYGALDCGVASDAMLELTGGLTEYIRALEKEDYFEKVLKAFERGSLMAASIMENPDIQEEHLENGLVKGHAYSVTSVRLCRPEASRSKPIKMIRLRNPWGNGTEWKGSWSDGSTEWKNVSKREKEEMRLTFEGDGEFWMSFEDFCSNFTVLEMTHVNLQAITDPNQMENSQFWEVQRLEGSWIKGVSAGGCTNNPKTFPHNPKYIIELSENDEGSEKCTMIVCLIQRTKRKKKKASSPHPIGFSLFAIPPDATEKDLGKKFFKSAPEIEGLNCCLVAQQVSQRFELPQGKYCLVPSTMSPNEEADFILRIFTEKMNPIVEEDESIGYEENFNGAYGTTSDQRNSQKAQPIGFVSPSVLEDGPTIRHSHIGFNRRVIDWRVLQKALIDTFGKDFAVDKFNENSCTYLLSIVNKSPEHELDDEEFAHIWAIISSWKDIFIRHDFDQSGFLDGFELREALLSAGFILNDGVMHTIMKRYAIDGCIFFDDFIMCTVRMSSLMGEFHMRDENKCGLATFSLQDFLVNSL